MEPGRRRAAQLRRTVACGVVKWWAVAEPAGDSDPGSEYPKSQVDGLSLYRLFLDRFRKLKAHS